MSLVERERVGGQVLGGETLQQCGGHRLEVETVRNRHRPIRWDPCRSAEPRTSAQTRSPARNPATPSPSAITVPAPSTPGMKEGDVIETAAVVHVDIVDSRRGYLDQ